MVGIMMMVMVISVISWVKLVNIEVLKLEVRV